MTTYIMTMDVVMNNDVTYASWCGPASSTAILSTTVTSTLGSSNPVSSTNKFLIGLFDHFCQEYIFTCLPNN